MLLVRPDVFYISNTMLKVVYILYYHTEIRGILTKYFKHSFLKVFCILHLHNRKKYLLQRWQNCGLLNQVSVYRTARTSDKTDCH